MKNRIILICLTVLLFSCREKEEIDTRQDIRFKYRCDSCTVRWLDHKGDTVSKDWNDFYKYDTIYARYHSGQQIFIETTQHSKVQNYYWYLINVLHETAYIAGYSNYRDTWHVRTVYVTVP